MLLPLIADGGWVLNVSSGLARFTTPGYAAYAAKGGGVVRDVAAAHAHVAASIPLGRVGLPDDVGAAVAALLSDEGRWINGTRIEVSGGQSL